MEGAEADPSINVVNVAVVSGMGAPWARVKSQPRQAMTAARSNCHRQMGRRVKFLMGDRSDVGNALSTDSKVVNGLPLVRSNAPA